MTQTPGQRKLKNQRRKRWEKAEKPFFTACLTCALSCEQTAPGGAATYDILTCPKAKKGMVSFPYKLEAMRNKEEDNDGR